MQICHHPVGKERSPQKMVRIRRWQSCKTMACYVGGKRKEQRNTFSRNKKSLSELKGHGALLFSRGNVFDLSPRVVNCGWTVPSHRPHTYFPMRGRSWAQISWRQFTADLHGQGFRLSSLLEGPNPMLDYLVSLGRSWISICAGSKHLYRCAAGPGQPSHFSALDKLTTQHVWKNRFFRTR